MKSKPRFTKFKSTETAGKDRKWYVVDAKDRVLGRLASQIASVLRGKTTAAFSPHIDNGHFVVVINAEKIALTGKKMSQKLYRQHSGYVGGLKEETAERVLARKPENVIRLAVKGMLPKGPLGKQQITKLKIYAGEVHPHSAQKPEAVTW